MVSDRLTVLVLESDRRAADEARDELVHRRHGARSFAHGGRDALHG